MSVVEPANPSDPPGTADEAPGTEPGPRSPEAAAQAPSAPEAGSATPRPTALTVTAIVATLGVVAAAVGMILLLVPIKAPVTDCGTSIGYLWDGRLDQPLNPDAPPEGATAAEARAENAKPCHDRVVDWAVPGIIAVGLGTAVGIAAVTTEGIWRAVLRHRRNKAARA